MLCLCSVKKEEMLLKCISKGQQSANLSMLVCSQQEICRRPEFIVDGASRTDICQGALGKSLLEMAHLCHGCGAILLSVEEKGGDLVEFKYGNCRKVVW